MSQRDGMNIINTTPHPIDQSRANYFIEMEKQFRRDMVEMVDKKVESVQNEQQSLEEAVRRNTQNIAVNTEDLIEKMQQISDLSHTVNRKADVSEIEPLRIYWEYESRTNWISHIVATSSKPIPYALDGNKAVEQRPKDNRGIFDVVADGFQHWSDQQLGRPKRKMNGNQDITDTATSATLRPFDCLQFANDDTSQWIEVSLIEKMKPFEFVYIHMDKAKLQENDRNKSPKRFRFYGRIKLDEPWTIMEVKEDKILDVNESVIKLQFEENTGFKFMRIEYDVNEGAPTTRIYRMRIHAET